jgi:glycosyltransferase involved in cell wall biosynthesis
MKPRIAVLGTYPPTQCGIATFSQSLVNALVLQHAQVGVVRLLEAPEPRPSAAVIHQHVAGQNANVTANVINHYDAVVVQHEYGIFGGEDGAEILEILAKIKVPKVVVLHTVLRTPTRHQKIVMRGIIDGADVLVTMTQTAKQYLIEGYAVEPDHVKVIPHGSADLRTQSVGLKRSLRPTILTWGLISQGKGIEWGIKALAQLSDLSPRPRYVVAGQTHPKVINYEGERYRNSLQMIAERCGVADDVIFVDKYLDAQSLRTLIQAADIVLLPYDSTEQVTSGVLVEAVVAGKPIVATKFPHALELLSDGSGELVNQRDARDMAEAMRKILVDVKHAQSLRKRAAAKVQSLLWTSVGEDYLSVLDTLDRPRMSASSAHAVG